MRIMSATLFSLIMTAAQTYAASEASGVAEYGRLTIGFISFGALIILFQFVPVLLLIGGMVGAMIKKSEKKSNNELVSADEVA